jgi:transposase-like protein
VFFDALRVKIRDEGAVRNKAVYLAIGVRCSGQKEILGLRIEQSEGATFWLWVMTELKNRGTQDILIAVVDGLKGFPEAIESVFPQADQVIPFFAFAPAVRKIIYTTNAIESLHSQVRKAVRITAIFPATKVPANCFWCCRLLKPNGNDRQSAGIRLRRNLRYTSKNDSW